MQSLQAHNRRLEAQGRPPVQLEAAPESLEDDDLLEMVNAGLIPATVVDNYLADYWKQVFTDLNVHSGLALRTQGNLAVAIRKGSPQARRGAQRVHRRIRARYGHRPGAQQEVSARAPSS